VEEEVSSRSFDRRLTWRLLRLVAPYWRAIGVALTCLLANAFFQVLTPLLTKIAVDRYLVPNGQNAVPWLERWLPAAPRDGLTRIILFYLLLLVTGLVADFGQQLLMQWTGQRAMSDLRMRLMSRLNALDIAYFDHHPAGRLVTRLTTDVDALNELFTSGLVTLLGDVLTLTFIFGAMFRLSPPLSLLMLGVMPLVFLVTVAFRRAVRSSNRRIRVAVARINSFLREHVSGMAVLQLFNRESRAEREFDAVNRDHMLAYRGSIQAYGWFYPAIELLSSFALASLLAYGGLRVRGGALTLGVLVAFFQYGLRIFRPIQDLSEKYNILQSALAAAERIFQLLDEPSQITTQLNPRSFPDAIAAIEFDHVWFAYQGEEWVLRDVSFTIGAAESVAIVGHTGAGKTTLTNLLLRFYDVQRGAIRVGGVDIREFPPERLRAAFGIVLQDPHLFTGTIADNIRLGSAMSTEALDQAAEQVNLLGFIRSLPTGFEHAVREGGGGLSTGQKQLLGFARALARNPRYLVLDEATSSVDTETEMLIRQALDRLIEGRTSIVIAHRLSTIQRADRILVMHKGKLRESGTHQELLAGRGIYWKLYQLQYKDQERRR
jgi:ATP-binding cassette subfamily B protein